MLELFEKYYHFFDGENGENTCALFTAFSCAVLIIVVIEIVRKIKHKKSLFF